MSPPGSEPIGFPMALTSEPALVNGLPCPMEGLHPSFNSAGIQLNQPMPCSSQKSTPASLYLRTSEVQSPVGPGSGSVMILVAPSFVQYSLMKPSTGSMLG